MALSNDAINLVLQATKSLLVTGQCFTSSDVRNAVDALTNKQDGVTWASIDHSDVSMMVRGLYDHGFLVGYVRANLNTLSTDTYDPLAAPEVPTTIVPTVNLSGQVVIAGGNGGNGGNGEIAPPLSPTPTIPKLVSPQQLDNYLNTWNKPETRTSTSGEGLLVKLKCTLRDLLS
jgi:hypothetical protein